MSLMSSRPFLSGSEMSSSTRSSVWLTDDVQCLAGGVGFGADLQVRLVVDQLRQPLAHHRMIVHDEHAVWRRFIFWRA